MNELVEDLAPETARQQLVEHLTAKGWITRPEVAAAFATVPRALNAEEGLKIVRTEIVRQRSRIGELLGQIRELQAEWDDETIARITTDYVGENEVLAHQVWSWRLQAWL
ncbi:hypothetical protein GCM10010172_85850 [Paractinoplanes ferrugineus]|uniref:Uncharacterized protein n=1 Tax=Paractinoplanes ferrugineus TaxID=113564 RepID=A0A919JDJ8_9ACTN|nr:hypothetical protein [Actinoplanes ferrugineus]GIE15201.1 hypothetical protein Afe05nite_70410 [Actinoplanes ferrugineus]